MQLTYNQRYILERKYKLPKESDEHLFERVVTAISQAENPVKRECWKERFYNLLYPMDFLPGGSVLSNAGIPVKVNNYNPLTGDVTEIVHSNGGLNNCLALSVEDSIESVAETTRQFLVFTKHRAGIGIDLTPISYQGRPLRRLQAKEEASGVVSMMKVITSGTMEMSQGGSRRGAILVALQWDHPDIIHFINCKRGSIEETIYNPKTNELETYSKRPFENINISVLLTKDFWGKLDNGNKLANKVWEEIAQCAWETADPGVMYLDRMNEDNVLRPIYGDIRVGNACGELPIYPMETCCLGTINLPNHLHKVNDDYYIDWNKLSQTIQYGIRFLDDVLDVSYYPMPQMVDRVKTLRRIGLGVTGLADILLIKKIPYDSDDALIFVDTLFRFIKDVADTTTEELGREKGNCLIIPRLVDENIYPKNTYRRNITTLCCAPTGSLTMLMGCGGYSIEPLFSHLYTKRLPNLNDNGNENKDIEYTWRNPYLPALSPEDEKILQQTGMLRDTSLPKNVKHLFATTREISPDAILKLSAQAQKHIDSSIAQTINLPKDATTEDIKSIFREAYNMGKKSVTIYRDESLQNQIIKYINNNSSIEGCKSEKGCDL